METTKDLLNFCYAAIFYDCRSIGITRELYQVRKRIINSFYKTIPQSLSIIDDIKLKIHDNDFEIFIENFHDLRENILNMLSFEKPIRDDQQMVIEPILNDDE